MLKKTLITFLTLCMAFCCASAQDNMVPFRHMSVGAEMGLHGLGVEVAVPVQRHLVFKAGYNWAARRDLFNTDIIIDTKELREIQEQNAYLRFENKFEDEVVITSGLCFGMNNIKAMVNWYPFALGRFYLSGGIYYTFNKRDPFIRLSGYTTREDWAALKELNDKMHKTREEDRYKLALEIDGEQYAAVNRENRGYIEADFVTSQFKYYVGMGLGRCIPNKTVGLQLEVGAMIYNRATLYCQDKEIESIREASVAFGEDTREILEYVDKYPVYPQVTMRFSFRMF